TSSLVEDESATADETAQETEKETVQETVSETEAEKTLSADDLFTEANINIRRGGRVAHANGYTYFVQAGFDNDSRENGRPNSENVYRIADSDPEGEAELLFKLPTNFEYGTAQDTIFCLLPGKDSLFFVDNTGQIYWYEYGDNFVRSPRQMNSDLGLVERVRLKQCISRTEDKVYFLGETVESYDSATGETTLRPICCVLNINSGRGELMEEFDPDISLKSGETAVMATVTDEHIYYAKCVDDEPYGFYMAELDGGNEKEICPLPADDDCDPFYAYDCIFYNGEDEQGNKGLVAVDAETGDKKMFISKDDICDRSFLITDDRVLFADDAGNIYSKEIGAESEAEKIFDSQKGIRPVLRGKAAGRIWYEDEGGDGTFSVSAAGRILPATPVAPTFVYEEKSYGDFKYVDYPGGIMIIGYTGNDDRAEIPAEINGKSVKFINIWSGDHPEMSLTIPEGVRSIIALEDKKITELYLPSSVDYLVNKGLKYTIKLAEGAVIHYSGSYDYWNMLVSENNNRFGGTPTDSAGSYGLKVICESDGKIWGETVTVIMDDMEEQTVAWYDTLGEILSETKNVSARREYYDDGTSRLLITRIGTKMADTAKGEAWHVYVNGERVDDWENARVEEKAKIEIKLETE
ncbi:MAG: hypothetical protein K5927_00200, partial [Lachnospiraceae bacterium]|nr:hypothetical protein [Lachnospiraceae bacterium]